MINESWHSEHKMPKNSTLNQRVSWHKAHEKNCDCRVMPENLRKIIMGKHNFSSELK